MIDYLLPALLLGLCLAALKQQEDGYALLLEGGREGLHLVVNLLPTLVLLLTAVEMLKASGAAGLLEQLLAPVLKALGIPPETALLVLVRPISGSAALALGAEIMASCGPDSLAGRTAAVMLGSTETTFYTLSVYCGAAGVSKTRYALPAALFADFVGFTAASAAVRFFWGR